MNYFAYYITYMKAYIAHDRLNFRAKLIKCYCDVCGTRLISCKARVKVRGPHTVH